MATGPFAAFNQACIKTFGSPVTYQPAASAPFAVNGVLQKDTDEERHQDGVYAPLHQPFGLRKAASSGRRSNRGRQNLQGVRGPYRPDTRRVAPATRTRLKTQVGNAYLPPPSVTLGVFSAALLSPSI